MNKKYDDLQSSVNELLKEVLHPLLVELGLQNQISVARRRHKDFVDTNEKNRHQLAQLKRQVQELEEKNRNLMGSLTQPSQIRQEGTVPRSRSGQLSDLEKSRNRERGLQQDLERQKAHHIAKMGQWDYILKNAAEKNKNLEKELKIEKEKNHTFTEAMGKFKEAVTESNKS